MNNNEQFKALTSNRAWTSLPWEAEWHPRLRSGKAATSVAQYGQQIQALAPSGLQPRCLPGLCGVWDFGSSPASQRCPRRPGQHTQPWAWPWLCRRGTVGRGLAEEGKAASSWAQGILSGFALGCPPPPAQCSWAGKEQDRERRILYGSRPMTLNVFHSSAVQYGSH